MLSDLNKTTFSFTRSINLTESKSLHILDKPIIILTHNALQHFMNDSSLINEYLQDILKQSKKLIQNHLAQRQPVNLWSSQFEMPVYPWLLPCSNFPRCRKVWTHYEDFDHLFPTLDILWQKRWKYLVVCLFDLCLFFLFVFLCEFVFYWKHIFTF